VGRPFTHVRPGSPSLRRLCRAVDLRADELTGVRRDSDSAA
jgi:hypothetical protein